MTTMTDDGQRALMPALTLIMHEDGEPRIRDLDLARGLQMAAPRNIRMTITQNRLELEEFGPLHAVRAMAELGSSGQREVTEYWLNEGQALTLISLSRTPVAAQLRHTVIQAYMAWRHGEAAELGAMRAALLRARPRWARLLYYKGKGLNNSECARLLRCNRTRVREMYREMVDCGIITPEPGAMHAVPTAADA